MSTANVGSIKGEIWLDDRGWTNSIKNVQQDLRALGRGMIVMGTAVTGAVFAATKEFASFDKAMRESLAVSSQTATQFEEMGRMAEDAAVKFNKAATETATGFYFLGSAGLSATEQMQAFNTTVALARALSEDTAMAAEGLVDVIKAYNMEFTESARVGDILVKTITSSNQVFADLDKALSYVSATANLMNNTLAETSAVIGVMANAGIKGCYDDQTEVLTRRGWLPWAEVNMNDVFATRNPNTRKIEYQKPVRLIRYHHKGKMYHVANRSLDLCVTPDHRMWVKKRDHDDFHIQTAQEVDGKNVRYETGGLKWDGEDCTDYVLQGFTRHLSNRDEHVPPMSIDANLWATFMGWYISEGSCDLRNGNYRIRITQNQGAIRDKMRRVLNKLPVNVGEDKNGFSIINEQMWKEVKPLGKAPQKYIPEYIRGWSQRLLTSLLSSLMEGDGDVNNCYYTSSKRLADDVTEIALKLGNTATMVMKSPAGTLSNYDKEGREIISRHDQWKVSVRDKQPNPCYYPYEYKGVHGKRLDGSKFPHTSEWVDYDGEVFCAEVPNHLLIVRRNGKPVVSGNSMAGVAMRRAITNLMSPTGDMRDLMYQLGVNIFDAEGRARPFIEAFGDISDALAGTTEQVKNMAFETLFGRRAIAGMIKVFDFGKVGLRAYANELENSAGSMEEVTKKQMAAFSNKIGQIWQQLLRVTRAIGSTLVPTLERLGKVLQPRIVALTEWIKINKEWVASMMKAAFVIGPLSIAIGTLLIVLPTLVRSVALLATAFTALIWPLVAVAAAFYALRAVWDVTLEDLANQWQNLTDFLAKDMGETLKVINADLDAWLIRSLGVVGRLAIGMKWALGETAKSAAATMSFYIHLAKGEVEEAMRVWDVPWDQNFGDIFEGAADAVKVTTKYVSELGSEMWVIANADWSKGIKSLMEQLRKSIPMLSELMNIFKDGFYMDTSLDMSNLRKRIAETGKLTVKGATDYSSQWAATWDNAAQLVANSFKSTFDGLHDMFLDFRDAYASSLTIMMRKTGKFTDNVREAFDNLFDAIYQSMVKFVADVTANTLLTQMLGVTSKGEKVSPLMTWGNIASMMKQSQTSYTPGLQSGSLNVSTPTQPWSPIDLGGGAQKVSIVNTNTGPDIAFKGASITQDGKALIIQTVTEEAGNSPAFKGIFREQ